MTRLFFTTTVPEELSEYISEREIENEPFAPRHLPRLYRTHFVLSILSPASGAYLGRTHSVADVHVIVHSVLVVGYPKLPAFGSTGAGTVVRLARGNQCSCTSGRMITACALHSHVLYNVFYRDWGRETVSKRHCVPPPRSGHVLAKKKRKCIPPADPSLYSDLFGLSPPLLLS